MTVFYVPDMSCGHCRSAIEKAISTKDAGAEIIFDMDARKVQVASRVPASELAALLKDEGYPPAETT